MLSFPKGKRKKKEDPPHFVIIFIKKQCSVKHFGKKCSSEKRTK